MNDYQHITVFKQETVNFLNVKKGLKYIDATLGGGGHTQEMLQRGGVVLGIDQDEDAIRHCKKTYKDYIQNKQLILVKDNFTNIKKKAEENDFAPCQGIVFDLGVSSYHFDSSSRGFSFSKNEPLDMRMDKKNLATAQKIVNEYTEDELYNLFSKKGEITNAKVLAKTIVEERKNKKIKSTEELVSIIEKVIAKQGKTHPATKVFMAIRLEVNQELEILQNALKDAFELLEKKGRLCTISFHSGEDRIVKNTYRKMKNATILTKKPITATFAQTQENPRSRSAKLRVIEKL